MPKVGYKIWLGDAYMIKPEHERRGGTPSKIASSCALIAIDWQSQTVQ